MLIDEHYRNILSRAREIGERLLNHRGLRSVIDDKEVLLSVRGLCDMLHSRVNVCIRSGIGAPPTPTPASKSPVTESYKDVRSSLSFA